MGESEEQGPIEQHKASFVTYLGYRVSQMSNPSNSTERGNCLGVKRTALAENYGLKIALKHVQRMGAMFRCE